MPVLRARHEAGPLKDHESESDDEAQNGGKAPSAAASGRPPRPAGAPKRPPRQRPAAGTAAPLNLKEVTLFEVVSKHGKAVKLAAKEWAERYTRDAAGATAELFTVLFQTTGCEYTVTEEDVDGDSVDTLVEKLSDRLKDEGGHDWLTAKGAKTFRNSFEDLWDHVTKEAHSREFLFDDILVEKLIHLLTAMGCSELRAFRLCAAVTATQLVTSWIHVMDAMMTARDTAQRQLTAEEKKGKAARQGERAATLRRTLDLSHRNTQDLQVVVSNLFQAVFAHRFRDVHAPIRATVISGIGTWVRTLPAVYLKDQFLKYLAWALSDKDAEVRKAGILALTKLYSEARNVSSLEGFTERFSRRFVELIYDVDASVAVLAVKLLAQVLEVQALGKEKVSEVYGLLIDTHHDLRHAAADLIVSQLEELGGAILAEAKTPKKAKVKQPTELDAELAGLLYVMRELSKNKEEEDEEDGTGASHTLQLNDPEASPLDPEVVAIVVDAMHERAAVLTDWLTLAAALADDSGARAVSNTTNAVNLLNLVTASVRKACGSKNPGAALALGGAAAAATTQKQERSEVAARQEATVIFMKALPKLIRKYQAEPRQATMLIELTRELKLDLFMKKKDEKGFEALLQAVVTIFGKHTDGSTIQECIHTLNFFVEHGPKTLQDRTELAMNKCLDEMMVKLKDCWGRLNKLSKTNLAAAVAAAEEDGEEDPVLYGCQVALMRLYHLQTGSSKHLGGVAELEKLLDKILQGITKGKNLTKGIVQYTLLNRFALLAWDLTSLFEAPDDREAIDRFVLNRDEYMNQLQTIGDTAHDPASCSRIFEIQSDLYLLLGHALRSDELSDEIGHTPTDDDLIRYWALGRQIIAFGSKGRTEGEAQEDVCLTPVETLVHASKLLTNGVVKHPSWLSGQLISYLVLGNEAKEVVKDLEVGVDRAALPELYLDALQAAWGRAEDAEEEEHERAAKQVQSLSFRVMQMYRRNSDENQDAIEHILRGGIRFACLDLPNRVAFLGFGLGNFIGRLTPEAANEMAKYLEAESRDPLSNCKDDEAEFVSNFIGHLQNRATGAASMAPETGDDGADYEEDEEEDVQPTEEQLGDRPAAGGGKRPAVSAEPDGEAPPRPRRRRQ